MHTRLSRYCDWFIEAVWLLAVTAVPLYFNLSSSRIFEPDKISLFRTLVLLMLAAWVIKIIDTRGQALRIGDGSLLVWRRLPFLLPVLAFVGVTIVSTVASVDPQVSIFGSYQRFQGVYSLVSYILFGVIVAFNLRTRDQLDRAVTFAILASFPILVYGMLQHFNLDPLPWGGDVTFRVTASMGNSIFLAAYLIMIVPLTLSRIAVSAKRFVKGDGRGRPGQNLMWLAAGGMGIALQAAIFIWGILATGTDMTSNSWWLLLFVILIISGLSYFIARVRQDGQVWRAGLTAGYILLVLLQLLVTFYTQSRGPWLGLMAGIFIFAILLVIRSGSRVWMTSVGAAAAVLLAFLVIFNMPGGPLEALKSQPYIGRLGQLLETDTGTGKVRVLIWSGAIDMITADPLRSAIGYGPETMYQAYNKFYPPELAHIEARNATPDRSHNAYLDYVVNSGVLGLAAYVFLVGGILTAGWRYWRRSEGPLNYLLAALLAGITAHLIEIAVGIPIAVTNVYFWFFAGLIFAAGLSIIPAAQAETAPVGVTSLANTKEKKQKASQKQREQSQKRGPGALLPYRKNMLLPYIMIAAAAIVTGIFANVNPIRADMVFKEGVSHERVGNIQVAMSKYEEATALAPGEDYYFLFLGRMRLETTEMGASPENTLNALKAAEQSLLTARDLRPLNTDHAANLGRLYSKWADLMGDRSKLELAVEYFRQATELSPNNAQIRNEYALSLKTVGRNAEAVVQLERSIETDSKYGRTYVAMGDVYREMGQPEKAADSLAKAAALDVNALSADSQLDKRIAYLANNRLLDELMKAVEQALADPGMDSEDQAVAGYIYSVSGDLAGAIRHYEEAVRLRPADITHRKNLAILYRDAGRLDDAAEQVQITLQYAETVRGVTQDQYNELLSLQAELEEKLSSK